MRFVLLLCLVISFGFSEENPHSPTPFEIASFRTDLLIGGVVNPLNGQVSLRQTDLVAKGAQEVTLSRVFIPHGLPNLIGLDPFLDYILYPSSARSLIQGGWVSFPHQFLTLVKDHVFLNDRLGNSYHFSIKDGKTTLAESPYGITNLSGDEPSGRFDPRNTKITQKNDKVIVQTPNGTLCHYDRLKDSTYQLEKEILPSGKIIRYRCRADCLLIQGTDPKERYVYATIKKSLNGNYLTSTGLKATYTFDPFLTHVNSPFYPSEVLEYNDRCHLTHQNGAHRVFRCSYAAYDLLNAKIDVLSFPHEGTSKPLYFLDYESPIPGKKGGTTVVKNVDGTKTLYHFSKQLVITSIQTFYEGKLQKEKQFEWTDNQWLKSIKLLDGDHKILSKKIYNYDRFGNPVVEIFVGPDDERREIKRVFSDDGLHLLLREEEEGKITTYKYLPSTNLLTKRVINDLMTEIYTYDDCHHLIKKEVKGGNYDLITRYTLRQKGPFLHLPEWIEEPTKKTHLSYDRYGNVTKEDIYDPTGLYAYTIYREFNERGDLLSETDPLGNKTTYTYTPKGYCTSITSPTLHQEMTYDMKGRLRTLQAENRLTQYLYDINDHLIQKKNPFGHSTLYTYHPLYDKPIQTSYLESVTSSSYDIFGREIEKTDPNGNITKYFYNIYGSPTKIIHPDKSRELFAYTPSGKLKCYTDGEGFKTFYAYDVLDRLVSKKTSLTEERFTYDPFNLIQETDKEGHAINYSYNKIGQKIGEERCGRAIKYSYDALGRLSFIQQDDLVTKYEKDFLDRVLEVNKSDLYKIAYTYDSAGNLTSIKHGTGGIELFAYDPFNRLTQVTDPLSNITTISYHEIDHLTKITTDPLGVVTKETFDPHDRLIKKEISDLLTYEQSYDPSGNLIEHKDTFLNRSTTFTYTKRDQLASVTRGNQTTSYLYSPNGHKIQETKPDGTVLKYSYSNLGHLQEIKSNHLHHTFLHNRLGHLLSAKDEKLVIEIKREVDPFGNVLEETLPQGSTIIKTYDSFDRPLSLTIDQNVITYDYDPLYLRKVSRHVNDTLLYSHSYNDYNLSGQTTSESLIQQLGSLNHTYDTKGRKIASKSPYHSEYLTYDSTDNLTQQNRKHFSYDPLSRLTHEPHYSYAYDSNENRLFKNQISYSINEKDQLSQFPYDANGNQLADDTNNYHYDDLNRLIRANDITFSYDPLGRRLSKTYPDASVENYLYDGETEIGTFGKTKQFRVIGNETVAIELNDTLYAPLLDIQNNITHLIDPSSKTLHSTEYTSFGEISQPSPTPWTFSQKRFDPELNLFYFGHRYYNPTLGRWLTPDPENFLDSYNLYQYALNNPFKYYDPNGRSLVGFLIGIGEIIAGGTILATGCALEIATFGGYTVAFSVQAPAGIALMSHGYYYATDQSKDLNFNTRAYQQASCDSLCSSLWKTNESVDVPPYDGTELGNDPTKCPGEGFEWRGKGNPTSGKGSWYNPTTGESLHPDLRHPPPIKPHWDYEGPNFPNGWRLNIDGTAEPKTII